MFMNVNHILDHVAKCTRHDQSQYKKYQLLPEEFYRKLMLILIIKLLIIMNYILLMD
ncbi:hypothetical protein RhiirC2_446453 [Rhizophagus irregularis]|uniref:Uncharacterized protein n=1 Tax=Rhizophagus irregularis TaxID=588596 RepID=A0A2N1NAF0_9GLOM|nr:hypothetical protein RhiirC2_446453 [Rhizophagus irregularis]